MQREIYTCYPAKIVLVLNDEFCQNPPNQLVKFVPFIGSRWGDEVYNKFQNLEDDTSEKFS